MDFGFYDWVTYRTNDVISELIIVQLIWVSHKVSQILSYWILTVSGRPISCMNVQRLTEEEQETDEYSGQMEHSNTLLNERLDAKDVDIHIASVPDWNWLSIEDLDPEFGDELHKVISDNDLPHDDEE